MSRDGPATLKDVARTAGVSRSTASRVLNEHPSVRSEVRRRVQAAMAELGYVRDEVARSLRSGTSQVIALAIPRPPATIFGDAYFATLVAGVVAAGARRDRTVAIVLSDGVAPVGIADDDTTGLGDTGTDRTFARLPERLAHPGLLDGAIVAASIDLDGLPRELMDRGLPIVVVGDPGVPGVSSVDVDNEAGGRIAVEHLVARGRRRIALVGGPATNASARSRQEGARTAAAAAGAAVVWEAMAVDFTVAAGAAAMQDCLAATERARPDAVVAGSDAIASGVLDVAASAGLHVPADLAVVGFDDLPPARMTSPPLTTVRQRIDVVADLAVAHLVDLVAGTATIGRRQVLDVCLVDRGSTPDSA